MLNMHLLVQSFINLPGVQYVRTDSYALPWGNLECGTPYHMSIAFLMVTGQPQTDDKRQVEQISQQFHD